MSPTFPTGVYEKRAVSRGNIPIISYFYEFNLIFRVKRPGKNGVKEKHPGLNL